MAINSVLQTIRNAEIDARSLSEFVSKDASFTVTRRLAPTIHTLDYYLLVLNRVKDKGDLADIAISDTLDKLEQLEPTVIQRVEEAINNTAVEGGVLADTFVTKTINGVGQVARSQRDKNSDFVHMNDFESLQAAIDYIGGNGGGVVYVPRGKHEVSVSINHPNVRIVGDSMGSTHLYALNRDTVVNVATEAHYSEIENITIHGYTIEQEGVPAQSGDNLTENTNAAYSLKVQSPKFSAKNVSVNGARFDSVYISVPTDANSLPKSDDYITFNNFYFGASARQPLSIIRGFNLSFINGTIYQDHSRAGSQESGLGNSIYFVDFEPNSVTDIWSNVRFEGVVFESRSTAWGGKHIVLNDSNMPDKDTPNIKFLNCKFLSGAWIRARSGRGRDKYNITLQDVYSEGALIGVDGGESFTIKLSTIKDCVFTNWTAFYGARFGEGTTLDNVKYREIVTQKDKLELRYDTNGILPNVMSVETINDSIINGSLSLVGSDAAVKAAGNVTAGKDIVGKRNIVGYYSTQTNSPVGKIVESRAIDVSNTESYTDLLRVGYSGSSKITIAGQDSSSGEWSICVAEAWIVCSGNNCVQAPINYIINDESKGADVQWRLSATSVNTGYRDYSDTRTLQIKPRASSSNQYIVTIETHTSYSKALPEWLYN